MLRAYKFECNLWGKITDLQLSRYVSENWIIENLDELDDIIYDGKITDSWDCRENDASAQFIKFPNNDVSSCGFKTLFEINRFV